MLAINSLNTWMPGSGLDTYLLTTEESMRDKPLSNQEIDDKVARDPYYQKVVMYLPFAAVDAPWELTTDQGLDVVATTRLLSDLEVFEHFKNAQIVANCYGKAQLLLDYPGNYWNKPPTGSKPRRLMGVETGLERIAGGYTWGNESTKVLHPDRAIEFVSTANGLSLVQGFHKYWSTYYNLIIASSVIANRKDFLLMSEDDLEDTLKTVDDPNGYLRNILDSTRRTIKNTGVLLSDSRRQYEYVSRSLQDIDKLLEHYRGVCIGASGLTELALFGFSLQGGGLGGDDSRDRALLSSLVDRLRRQWTRGVRLFLPDGLDIKWISSLRLSPKEEAEVKKTIAETDSINKASGAISTDEIRNRFAGQTFNYELTLIDGSLEATPVSEPPAPDPIPVADSLRASDELSFDADSYNPTKGMVAAARKGLGMREKHGRGGTAVGIARARDIVNGRNLSARTVLRMYSFFSRHEVDKQGKDWSNKTSPSNGRIAWLLWGGDAGYSWSTKIRNQIMKSRS
jgi:hypothetical protein